MHKASPILAAAIAATFAGAAMAQPDQSAAGSPADAFIEQLDNDGDGKISLEEALAPQKSRFDESDTDGDGFITPDEASTAFNDQVPPEMLEAMKERGMPNPGETFVKNLDTNEDGKVDRDEFEQPTVESFERMDRNDDDLASSEEADAFFQEMKREMQEQMQRMQQQQGGMPPQQ